MSDITPDVEIMTCRPVFLDTTLQQDAADWAVRLNPANRPLLSDVPMPDGDLSVITPLHLAVLTGRYWQAGTTLTVDWLDNPSTECRRKILENFRFWTLFANITVVESRIDPMVRVARQPGDGYWSYLGTDILHIPREQPTMNLDSFTEKTIESEYHRVVRHEFGHTLGCPHEQQRAAIVNRLNPAAVYQFFGSPPNNWSKTMVDQQILTPISESSLWGTAAEEQSIMCYQFHGNLTKDGKPIPGGTDLTDRDKAFIAKVYPGRAPVVPPPGPGGRARLEVDGAPLSDQISRPGEIDEFDLTLATAGKYVVQTAPSMETGLFTPDGRKLLARGYGDVSGEFSATDYRVKVMHRYLFGRGSYRIHVSRVVL